MIIFSQFGQLSKVLKKLEKFLEEEASGTNELFPLVYMTSLSHFVDLTYFKGFQVFLQWP